MDSALIGAAALAVHGYTRGTEDIDLAVFGHPHRQLIALERQLSALGFRTQLRLPDDEYPPGGVLSVWSKTDEGRDAADLVEVVNFLNPAHPSPAPVREALADALPLGGSVLRCVRLEHLVALKLYAGGLGDHADIVQVLARNPGFDRESIRSVASRCDRDRVLEGLMEQAQTLSGQLERRR
ncbi:MAG: hypothetical protein MEQ07_01155 [Aquimonas sp.]|nr:hypothetical protein [Aquimonas sp.]